MEEEIVFPSSIYFSGIFPDFLVKNIVVITAITTKIGIIIISVIEPAPSFPLLFLKYLLYVLPDPSGFI